MKTFRSACIEFYKKQPDLPWLTIIRSTATKQYTVRDLTQRIHDFASYYQTVGLKQEDTVLIILKESLDLYASFFAGIMYGVLPAYFAYPSPKQTKETFLKAMENLIRYNEIRLLIGYEEIIGILRNEFTFPANDFLGFVDHQDIKCRERDDFSFIASAKHEAFLQFSSGTTGAKKGVKISTEALFNQIEAYKPFVKFTPESRIISWLPHYHDMGLIACMLMPYIEHVPVYMMSPFEWVANPKMLFEAITRYHGTHTWQPNFALGHLTKSVREEDRAQYDLSTLRQIICCSEPALAETVFDFTSRFIGIGFRQEALTNCFAMAENTYAMTSTTKGPIPFLTIDTAVFQKEHRIVEAAAGRKIACAGVPLSNVSVKILSDDGKDLPENFVGEVIIKSDCMLDCYHNNPEATQEAFFDGYFRTGDLGFLRNGELYITGRKKDLIIVGGDNIYPQDLELILNEEEYLIPGRNVVFGVMDDRIGTERIVILAETKEGCEGSDTTPLRTKIFNTLSVSVSEIILLKHMTLRKGTAGKISRYLNKNEYMDGVFVSNVEEKTVDFSDLTALVHSVIPSSKKPALDDSTELLSSGIIDSFAFVNLTSALEKNYRIKIPQSYLNPAYFQTLKNIRETVAQLQQDQAASAQNAAEPKKEKGGFFSRLFGKKS